MLGFKTTSAQAVSIRACLLNASKSFVKHKNTNDYMMPVCLDLIEFCCCQARKEGLTKQTLTTLVGFMKGAAKYGVMKDVFQNTSLSCQLLFQRCRGCVRKIETI